MTKNKFLIFFVLTILVYIASIFNTPKTQIINDTETLINYKNPLLLPDIPFIPVLKPGDCSRLNQVSEDLVLFSFGTLQCGICKTLIDGFFNFPSWKRNYSVRIILVVDNEEDYLNLLRRNLKIDGNKQLIVNIIRDEGGELKRMFGVGALPTTYFLRKDIGGFSLVTVIRGMFNTGDRGFIDLLNGLIKKRQLKS